MTEIEQKKAFEKLVREKKFWIRKIASKYLRNAEEIEEVVQDVFIKVWRNFVQMPSRENQRRGWLSTITIRIACDYIRAKKRLWAVVDYNVEIDRSGACRLLGQELVSASTVCEDATASYDPFIAKDVVDFLRELSSTHKKALLLALDGYSYDQVAKMTGVQIGTVRSRIHYARKKALKALKHHL